jgi:hypothetical protein
VSRPAEVFRAKVRAVLSSNPFLPCASCEPGSGYRCVHSPWVPAPGVASPTCGAAPHPST